MATFRMPVGLDRDPRLLTVSFTARYLFIVIVILAVEAGSSDGTVTAAQLAVTSFPPRALKVNLELLLDAGVLHERSPGVFELENDERWTLLAPIWSQLRGFRDESGTDNVASRSFSASKTTRTAPDRYANGKPEKYIPAGQTPDDPDPRAGARARPHPRDARINQDLKETPNGVPIPRGSDRNTVLRTTRDYAQRDEDDPGADPMTDAEGRKLTTAELIAATRAAAENGRKRNPAATGIDTRFSKYDPDRPITPMNSANLFGGETE